MRSPTVAENRLFH